MLVEPIILFGHVAYQLGDAFKARGNRERYIEVRRTRSYEIRVVDILTDSLGRLARGETQLRNQLV